MDSMIAQRLKNYNKYRRCTLLGVGPMSLNCVDAAIDIANENNIPLMLIASRRQIDSEEFGGGYVNNWTTQDYADYVIDRDKKGKIFLARDHGGPWQNEKEKNDKLSLRRAMESAKRSYKADIKAGFQILHIDPSVDIHGKPTVDDILDRIYELYEYCWNEAQKLGTEIIFEVGTEEQSGSTNTQEELEYTLSKLKSFCKNNHLPFPTFVVIQTGTRVMETCNVGSFDSPFRVANELPAEIQIPKMIEICNRYDILMKEHNTDYLSNESLTWHPRFGIHAANVAPEFGVAETNALITLLENHGKKKLVEDFLEIAYNSGKWEKWMLPDTKATDRHRAVIAGHYIFSTEEFSELKQKAAESIAEIDIFLKEEVKKSIMRYAYNFRLLGRGANT